MERRVAVRAIITHEGQLLCFKLKQYKEVTASDYWSTPGGTVEPGEALIPALNRELIEETGIAPKVGNLLYMQQYIHGGKEHLEFFFHVTNGADYLHIDLSKTSHGETEVQQYGFIDPSTKSVLPAFLASQTIEDDINDQHPVQIFNYIA